MGGCVSKHEIDLDPNFPLEPRGATGSGLSRTASKVAKRAGAVGAALEPSEWGSEGGEDAWAGDDDEAGAARGAGSPRPSITDQMELLAEVHDFQQQLALVHDSPLLGLPEAADLVAASMKAQMVAVWVFTPSPAAAVLVASSGGASVLLERAAVVRGQEAGDMVARAAQISLRRDRARRHQGTPAVLPRHLRKLLEPAGLRSFAYAPIGPPASPLGALLLAGYAPGAFVGEWLQVRLQAAAMGLLHHVRQGQVAQVAGLLREVAEAEDPVATVAALLAGARRFLHSATGLRAAVRVALLTEDAGAAFELGGRHPSLDGATAVLCELPRPRDDDPLLGPSTGSGAFQDSEAPAFRPRRGALVVTEMELGNTLVATALATQEARFITDCGKYMQASPQPARDIFTRASDLVASLVVVPLVGPRGEPLGGLYFGLHAAFHFGDAQDALMGFVTSIQEVLYEKLRDRDYVTAALTGEAAGTRPRSFTSAKAVPRARGAAGSPGAGSGDGSSGPLTPVLPITPGTSITEKQRMRRASSQRFNTEAMLQVLQQEIRRGRGRPSHGPGLVQELAVGEQIGRGAFGVVHRGYWNKTAAAVKIMYTRSTEHEVLKDAVEMAVLSTVNHPNIVQLYACLTDVVEVAPEDASVALGSASGSMSGSLGCNGAACTRFRRLQPEEPGDDLAPCNILVMEFCDKGTLREVVKAGAFHAELSGGALGVEVEAVLEVLLDVACALQYLHSMRLVHGDIKLENILMKSDASRRIKMVPKLGDFGLAKILNERRATLNLSGAGTLSHLAPELFEPGSRVTTAVDSYAFGILMWELWVGGQKAYKGLPQAVIADRVPRGSLRPAFPRSTPLKFSALASACWSPDPASRPGFGEIADRLESILGDYRPRTDDSLSSFASAIHSGPGAAAPPAPAAAAAEGTGGWGRGGAEAAAAGEPAAAAPAGGPCPAHAWRRGGGDSGARDLSALPSAGGGGGGSCDGAGDSASSGQVW